MTPEGDVFILTPPEPDDRVTREARRRALRAQAKEIISEGALFNAESWELFLTLIEEGYTLEEIAENTALPSWATLRRWIRSSPEREAEYKRARDVSADHLESRLLTLAYDTNDKEDVAVAKFKADIIKWVIPRRSKRYSDRIEQEVTGTALAAPTLVFTRYEDDGSDGAGNEDTDT